MKNDIYLTEYSLKELLEGKNIRNDDTLIHAPNTDELDLSNKNKIVDLEDSLKNCVKGYEGGLVLLRREIIDLKDKLQETKKELRESKDKLRRRNMQIKELKAQHQRFIKDLTKNSKALYR